MNNIKYVLKENNNFKNEIYQQLLSKNLHPLIAKLYSLRNIKNVNDVNLKSNLLSFKALKGIDDAVNVLESSIKNKEKICVVADYDVDGATACAIAVRGLKLFDANIDFFVPDRFIHGYGLQPSVVDEAIKKTNPQLIITVDNGILSHAGVDYANEKNIKVLVTDHHLAGETTPNATAIVNPNQKDCLFESKSLAGCGVIFYVLAALREKMINNNTYNNNNAPNIFSLLDLVALGTISDLVKLDKNNRILVSLGMSQIKKGNCKVGIEALCNIANKNHANLTTTDIGFALGPRINAAGRLEDMSIGINCLLTDSYEEALEYAKKLDEINRNRKQLESEMKEIAFNYNYSEEKGNSKVVYDESFHEGVIGIVASRLKEYYYQPTIVFAPSHDENIIKGSGRSIPEIHLRDALDYVYKKNPNIFIKFGGHAMAAGLTIYKDKYKEFCDFFDEAVLYLSDNQNFSNIKEIDLDLDANYFNIETIEILQNEIWGQGFPQPLFKSKFNILEQKLLKDAHLKLKLVKDNQIIDGIWFNKNQLIDKAECEFIFQLSINEFMNNKNIQILIDDIYKS